MKTNTTVMRRGFTLVELLVVIVIIAALAGLTAPMVIKQRKRADHTEAINNLRQVGLAMFQFEDEYGSFPDDTTATSVATATGKPAVTGAAANDRFRQLFSAGITLSEAMFYCKTSYTTKPDGVITTDADILKAGEVGFGLIMRGATTTAFSASGNPNRPICAAPFAKALDGTFDVDYYDGKSVILRMDNSVTSPVISAATQKPLVNGKDILDNTVGGLWAPDQPVFAFPLAKP